MSDMFHCPKCDSESTYQDRNAWVCLVCSYEWDPVVSAKTASVDEQVLMGLDCNGAVLKDGDSVTVIKDLKVKGFQTGIKVGTKVKNIHLVESNDGHNISCKIDGFGGMYLKSEFVKKAA